MDSQHDIVQLNTTIDPATTAVNVHGGSAAPTVGRVQMLTNEEGIEIERDCDNSLAYWPVCIDQAESIETNSGETLSMVGIHPDSDVVTMTDAVREATEPTKKKRKPCEEAAGANGECEGGGAVYDVEYAIVQRDSKRRKVEIRITRGCHVTPCAPHASSSDENRPVKPPVPPKPKHLVCRPPAHLLDNARVKAKFENAHTTAVRKLTAQAEQLRIENIELRAALSNERNAVRTLRYF